MWRECPEGVDTSFPLCAVCRTGWARGGGWQGPYIHGYEDNVLLNAYVVSQWFRRNGTATEAELFDEYVARVRCSD